MSQTESPDSQPSKPEYLTVNPDGIPQDLRVQDVWLAWKAEWRNGEWSKIPKHGEGGYNVDATDRGNGVGFNTAYETYKNRKFDGVGIILDADDLLVGFDWDDCRDPENPNESVPDLVVAAIEQLDSYTEVSPSKTGFRTLAHGVKPDGRKRNDLPCDPVVGAERPHLEVYDGSGGRYLTITGHCLEEL